jgi:hypothetical protein
MSTRFKARTVYKLKDNERFDDEYGEGYDHVETVGECDGMIITDCWPVNAKGKIHPGYTESPIPVHIDDIAEETTIAPSNQERERSGAMWA